MNTYNYLFKYVIVGDQNVGKSCILLQFIDKRFKDEHDPTIGVEFGSRNMKINDKNVRLQIWDTISSIGCILVFDVTNPESFSNIKRWLEDTQQQSHQNVQMVLVGNKVDLADKQVTEYQAKEFAQNNALDYYETSAKTGFNIDLVFQEATAKIIQKIDQQLIDPNNESLGIKQGGIKQKEEIIIKKQKLNEEKKKNCCQ